MNYLKFFPIILFVVIVLYFFKPFLLEHKLPIPSDTIVGLYHPFRDLYSQEYPRGIPFKNSLITDPVRQQYPWRELAITLGKKFELPLWNPYNLSGTPLLANMQSAALYPLNVLFFIFPFSFAWSILIILEPLLGGIFLYFYLNNLKLNKWASLFGAIAFSFSGFFVAWMEWGTILHVALWLPLALLSADKIFFYLKSENSKLQLKNKNLLIWTFIFIFSLASSLFAGHLQIFFYLFVFSILYLVTRWIQYGKKFNILVVFFISYILFFILTAVQLIPTAQFIMHSARDVDQIGWQQAGWFIPWQNLVQFIAPDFFGNPTTLNYWGAWNYGEFVGYIGIVPLIMAIFALFFRHDKKTFFFGVIFFLSIIFSFPTIFGKLPYLLNVPFLSSAQPTRLLFISDFSLAVLAAFGLDYFIRTGKKEILYPLAFVAFIIVGFWAIVLFGNNLFKDISQNLSVAKNNLIFPTFIFVASAILTVLFIFFHKKKIVNIILLFIIGVTVFDLLRFSFKFTPFTNIDYLFPETKVISFLQEQKGQFRIMATDSRIFPPNFSAYYRLQSVDGYDPLYLRRYGELIAASERGKPDISPPFGFNRIISPQNFESKIIDLLGVKYILSLSDLESTNLAKVFQEGETRVYENKNALPRVFFVEQVIVVDDKNETIEKMFEDNFDSRKTAIVEKPAGVATNPPLGCTRCDAHIVYYGENRVIIETQNDEDGFLVLTDSFYPTWRARIDSMATTIYRTDYNLRGIVVPIGKHTIELYATLF